MLYVVCSLGRTLLDFGFLLHSKDKFVCYSRYLLTFYICIPFLYVEKDVFFWMLVLGGLLSLHTNVPLQLLQHN